MLTFPAIIGFAAAIMGTLPPTNGHGTEVRRCLTPAGKLRFFVLHWHGPLSNPSEAGTMTIEDEATGDSFTREPDGVLNNPSVNQGDEWGCIRNMVPAVATSCHMAYNDWVYYDSVPQCTDGISYNLLQGNTYVLMEGCTELYPVNVSCAVVIAETQAPTALPTKSPTKAPTTAPTKASTNAPNKAPAEALTASPTDEPTASPTDAPTASPSFESVSHSVCENFAVHARTTITFDGAMSTIRHGDVGVSPGTSVTGAFTIDEGEVVVNSADFALKVSNAHAEAMQAVSTPMVIEIGDLTFTPGTYRSDSAINFAHGTVVTLDGQSEPNPTFLFIAGSTLVTAADTSFILMNGAKAENV